MIMGRGKKRLFKLVPVLVVLILLMTSFSGINVSKAQDSRDSVKKLMTKENPLDYKGYSTVLYNSKNGMPTSEANAIAQTSDGFIWIGCYSGLVRFDGQHFYRFDASSGITSVVSLYVDEKDRLWIGTNDRGIARFEDGKFKFWGKQEGLKSGSIKDIAADNQGNIILATTDGIAIIDINDKLILSTDEKISSANVYDLTSDTDGNVYGVTMSDDIFIVRDGKLVRYFSKEETGVPGLNSINATNNAGKIICGTDSSELIYINATESGINIEKSVSTGSLIGINTVKNINKQCTWVCANNGMGYLDGNDNFIERPDSQLNNSIEELMIDYEGNYWFTSSRQGVMKIAKSRFKTVYDGDSDNGIVTNTTCYYNGALLIGTDTGFISYDLRNNRVVDNKFSRMLSGIRVRDIITDSDSNVWICTYSKYGLICIHPDESYDTYTTEDGLASNKVRTAKELSNKDIVITCSGGVNIIRDGKVISSYGSKDGITNTEILTSCEAEDGSIYVGSDGAGIFHITENGIKQISQEDGLLSDIILRIKREPDSNRFWIVTANSIAFMENGNITNITTFPFTNNYDLYFYNDRTWVMSGNGIYSVNTEDLANNSVEKFELFDESLGLPCSVTANSRNAVIKDTLYVSGISKVYSVKLDKEFAEDMDIKLAIPYIEADDDTIYYADSDCIDVGSGVKRVTFYGFVLTSSMNNPDVSYYLEGFDDEPEIVKLQDLSSVSYTNLKGGEYTFHLSILDNDGNVTNEISVKISKEKPYYETVWFFFVFIGCVLLIFALLAYAYMSYKTKQYKKKQKENAIFIDQVIRTFTRAIDVKDSYTNGHSSRVAEYSRMLAKAMGQDEEEQSRIYNIASLHDVGKIMVPDEILCKPGKLTDEEYMTIKQHAQNGYDILKEIDLFPDIALGARYHHERIDGKGYPSGIKGDEIPFIAKIIAVADTFDAMNSTRPYRAQMNMEDIVKELKRVEGTQLDEEITEVLIKLIENGELDK